jgi:hypothetical protein
MNRKTALFLTMMVCFAAALGAEERQFSLGLGAEANKNAETGAAFGYHARLFYDLTGTVSLGFTLGVSHDFKGLTVYEDMLSFRWYFAELTQKSPYFSSFRFFAQGDMGSTLVHQGRSPGDFAFLRSFTGGMRISVAGPWYLEPYVRAGLPFVVGGGLAGGFSFAGFPSLKD